MRVSAVVIGVMTAIALALGSARVLAEVLDGEQAASSALCVAEKLSQPPSPDPEIKTFAIVGMAAPTAAVFYRPSKACPPIEGFVSNVLRTESGKTISFDGKIFDYGYFSYQSEDTLDQYKADLSNIRAISIISIYSKNSPKSKFFLVVQKSNQSNLILIDSRGNILGLLISVNKLSIKSAYYFPDPDTNTGSISLTVTDGYKELLCNLYLDHRGFSVPE